MSCLSIRTEDTSKVQGQVHCPNTVNYNTPHLAEVGRVLILL